MRFGFLLNSIYWFFIVIRSAPSGNSLQCWELFLYMGESSLESARSDYLLFLKDDFVVILKKLFRWCESVRQCDSLPVQMLKVQQLTLHGFLRKL